MKNCKAKAKTACYVGKENADGVIAFLGIPYCKAPRRWEPAEALEPSDAVFEAFEFGPMCCQPPRDEEFTPGTPMSEDCLTLNIWTDDLDKKGKPVMFWIHGGCYVSGSNRTAFMLGDKLVADCPDIVYVNINYRLGAFGAMDLSAVDNSGKYKYSNNLNLLDQATALKWVYENIEAFGGDPNNITVYGQSAGSFSTASLMLYKEANKYMKNAILESSCVDMNQKDLPTAAAVAELFRELTGANTLEELLALDPEKILEAQGKIMMDPRFPKAFESTGDGDILPADPYAALRDGIAKHINVMAGTVAGEYDTGFAPAPAEAVVGACRGMFAGHLTEEMITAYENNYPERDKKTAYMDLMNDITIRSAIKNVLTLQAEAGANTYMYYIDATPKGSNIRSQQYHRPGCVESRPGGVPAHSRRYFGHSLRRLYIYGLSGAARDPHQPARTGYG